MAEFGQGNQPLNDKTMSIKPLTEAQLQEQTNTPEERNIPRSLRFIVPDFNASFDVPARTGIMIGRRTSEQDGQVDVDMTPYDGRELGVSRYHAIIQMSGSQFYIKDLDSTNGTYINGFALHPLNTYTLNHGDQLTLGGLPLYVRYNYNSQQIKDVEALQRELDTIVERLRSIRWGEKTATQEINASNVELMQEFLRRMRLWSIALKIEHQWPLFDVAKIAYPPLRSQTRKLSQITASLFPNLFARMTCHWAIHWVEAAHTEQIQRFNLPSPYDPLILLYENGAWFQRDGDSIAIWETPGLWTHVELTSSDYNRTTPFVEIT